jgi:hypothetical protein
MAKNFTYLECDSYLGSSPICDVCKKPVVAGEKVHQEFVGTVRLDEQSNELGIVEEHYSLIHINCIGLMS